MLSLPKHPPAPLKKRSEGAIAGALASIGGDGGNRTPVQNRLSDIYYTFSRCFNVPLENPIDRANER
ncbi:hypothetical protein BH20CHL2_BH20CHL2_08690 [soil metagenome]